MTITFLLAAAVVAGASVALADDAPPAGDATVYIGTAASKAGEAPIYLCRMNRETGALSEPAIAAKLRRPSFLAEHPNGRFLYACDETSDAGGQKSGAVAGFAVDPAGKLTLLNSQMSGGMGPCFVEVDPSGRCLLVANYASGSVASLPIDPDSGKLSPAGAVDQHHGTGPNAKRQEGPHAHCFRVAPGGKFALAADLGTDQVMVYRLDAPAGKIAANDPPAIANAPGSGPRHLAFTRDGKFLYVGHELGNTVTTFAWNGDAGSASEIQTLSTLPDDFHESNTVAEVALSPDEKFFYVSNRGHDSIAIFAVDPESGKLTSRGQTPSIAKIPRHFAIDPSGTFMIVGGQNSNELVVFKVDATSGALTPTGAKVSVPGPTCIRFWK